MRPGELPPGLEPFEEAGTASLLPDGLARQAAVSFRREPRRAGRRATSARWSWRSTTATPTEYIPRFRDLMVKHQGYGVVDGDETRFRLTRTRGEETSAVVGSAHGEVLVVTTVAGMAGTVGPDDAAHLTQVAVARVPTVDQSAAALSTDPGARTMANAQVGAGLPGNPEPAGCRPLAAAGREPAGTARRSTSCRRATGGPVGDPSLNELMPGPAAGRGRPPRATQSWWCSPRRSGRCSTSSGSGRSR